MISDNAYHIGNLGEFWFLYECARRKIAASTYIKDYTHDIILPKNKCTIEVKTSHAHLKEGRRKYIFAFKDGQIKKDAFDYAYCVCLDSKSKVIKDYLIPQKYIYEQAKKTNNTHNSWRLKIPECSYTTYYANNAHWSAFQSVDAYEKFKICQSRFDLIDINNKSAFTRAKNKLYNQLTSFEELQHKLIKDKIKEWYLSGLKFEEIAKKLGCSVSYLYRNKWNQGLSRGSGYYNRLRHKTIDGKFKLIHKCKDCGLETHLKSRMTKHKQRKTSCKNMPNTWTAERREYDTKVERLLY
tara:strand:+ start:1349 stop:2239 length:891 start_codon:yes stop_codon:yes gene_type:complete